MNVLAFACLTIIAALAATIFRISGFARPPRWQRDPIRAGQRERPRRVLLTGATGFIGYQLGRRFIESGDELCVLTRSAERAEDLFGPHARVVTSLASIPDDARFDVIVNLAGAPIFDKRWTRRRREVLLESRLSTTQAIIDLIKRLENKPRVLISMSAVGYYGVRGDEELCEADRGRPIFQSQLCQMWELAAQQASASGVRVCRMRLGMVLGRTGGAFPRLALGARMRVRTLLGSAHQWMSWVHIEDVLRLIEFCIEHDEVNGAINATAPEPVRQCEFANALSDGRTSLSVRAPASILRRLLGERSQLLLDGQKVLPLRARYVGFTFNYPTLERAIAQLTATQSLQPSEIFYDAFCPVCSAEMDGYCRAATRASLPWRFADVSMRAELMRRYGLSVEVARRRVYVIDRGGALISGMEAIARIWINLPRWRILGRLLHCPPIRVSAHHFYDYVLAPLIWGWNQRRRAQLDSEVCRALAAESGAKSNE